MMRGDTTRFSEGKHHSLVFLVAVVAFSSYIQQVVSLPTDQWPTFPRRNVAALARDGYLKSAPIGFKRSISTLAKNGQLPTFRSPYDETDKQEQDEDGSHEKRHIASIARLRSYSAIKRNIQALARDGYRGGRSQYQQNDKRNIQAMARNGMIHKRDELGGDEYYYPFYQNQIPPLSEIDGPLDYNEIYDLQQSVNPDMFPPLSQVYKRSTGEDEEEYRNYIDDNWNLKRGAMGMPVHGLYRPLYVDNGRRNKRYVMSIPDEIEHNDIHDSPSADNANEDKRSVDENSDIIDGFEKRHIGSLARKHSSNENLGIRQYISSPEAESASYSDDPNVPPAAVSPHSHPTGRILHRPLNNDVPAVPPAIPSPPLPPPNYIEMLAKNRWHSSAKEVPKYHHFRSLKIPYHTNKRYLIIPAVDNFLLRKGAGYRNSSLPSRRKNQ